jgi:hypothetical protein
MRRMNESFSSQLKLIRKRIHEFELDMAVTLGSV